MTLRLNGSTSGSVSLDAPASTTGGADFTITLPSETGTLITNKSYKRRILEQFASIADGTSHVCDCGTITTQNVTGVQDLTTTWADATGSVRRSIGANFSRRRGPLGGARFVCRVPGNAAFAARLG